MNGISLLEHDFLNFLHFWNSLQKCDVYGSVSHLVSLLYLRCEIAHLNYLKAISRRFTLLRVADILPPYVITENLRKMNFVLSNYWWLFWHSKYKKITINIDRKKLYHDNLIL